MIYWTSSRSVEMIARLWWVCLSNLRNLFLLNRNSFVLKCACSSGCSTKDLNIYFDSKYAVNYIILYVMIAFLGLFVELVQLLLVFVFYFYWPQIDPTANATTVHTIHIFIDLHNAAYFVVGNVVCGDPAHSLAGWDGGQHPVRTDRGGISAGLLVYIQSCETGSQIWTVWTGS